MRHSLLLSALALTLLLAPSAPAAEGLFSEVPIDSVFTSSTPASESASSTASRFTGIGAIGDALRAAKFEPKEVDTQVVSIKMQRADWSIPVLVSISADHSQIWLVLLLGTVADEKALPADKLLALLAANRETAPAHFAYSVQRQRIELYQIVVNQGLTAAGLVRELEQLASIAEKHQPLWNFSSQPADTSATLPAATTPATSTPVQNTPATPSTSATVSNLVGKWAAARSDKEAFALQLTAEGTFVLVHLRDGKTNRSTGKFSFDQQELTLTGDDGSRLSGTVKIQSAREFQLQLQNAGSQPLTFQRSS